MPTTPPFFTDVPKSCSRVDSNRLSLDIRPRRARAHRSSKFSDVINSKLDCCGVLAEQHHTAIKATPFYQPVWHRYRFEDLPRWVVLNLPGYICWISLGTIVKCCFCFSRKRAPPLCVRTIEPLFAPPPHPPDNSHSASSKTAVPRSCGLRTSSCRRSCWRWGRRTDWLRAAPWRKRGRQRGACFALASRLPALVMQIDMPVLCFLRDIILFLAAGGSKPQQDCVEGGKLHTYSSSARVRGRHVRSAESRGERVAHLASAQSPQGTGRAAFKSPPRPVVGIHVISGACVA